MTEFTAINRRHFLRQLGAVSTLPLVGASLSSRAFAQSKTPAKSTAMRVMCANIRQTLAADTQTGDGWEQRRELCRDVLLKYRPDIFCFQESRLAQLDFFQEKLPGFTRFGIGNPPAENRPMQPGNAILFSSRFNLLAADGFWLSETPEVRGSKSWDSASVRYLNWVQLYDNHTHREFRIWNTHLDHMSQPAREGQTRTLLAATAKMPDTLPQLLTADFNADAGNPVAALLHAAGWSDTYAAVHGQEDPGFTFHGFHGPDYPKHRPANKNGKIDFIYSRGPWRVHSSEVVRDGRDGRYPSDHYFVFAELENL